MNNDYNNGQQGNNYQYGAPNDQNWQGNPYNPPYGNNPYGGNPYNSPYGGNPYNNPYGQVPPIYQQPFAGPDTNAKNAHTMGLLSVILLFFIPLLSIIFGALAMSYAKKSAAAVGYECSEAQSGRKMGMVGLIVSIVFMVLAFFIYLIYFVLLLAML